MDEFMSKEGVDKTWCSCTNIIWTQMMVIGLVIWTTLLTMIVLVGTCCKGSSLKQAWPYILAYSDWFWYQLGLEDVGFAAPPVA